MSQPDDVDPLRNQRHPLETTGAVLLVAAGLVSFFTDGWPYNIIFLAIATSVAALVYNRPAIVEGLARTWAKTDPDSLSLQS